MWGIWNFMAPVGFSPLFNGNPYHLLAFFLSTGALSGYGHHLATLPTKPLTGATLIRSGGASGAIFALFAAFCTQYPTAQLGIVFVPFSIAAINMLPAAMVFDLVGMVRGYKFVNNMAHAVSLPEAVTVEPD
jgi:rhomboid-like protein